MDNSDIVFPIQMFDPTRDFKKHESEYRSAMDQVLLKGNFIGGEQVMELEKQLAVYTGCENVITCANGTDAIFIALLGLGIGKGDEVITVAHTWISTAETIAMTGAMPIWVDIDPETFCIDPKLIEAKITSKTKAILPVSLYGLMPDYQAIKEIADKYNIPVIEDGAQSFGAEINLYKSCSCKYTDIATTSFFPTKPLGCYGDGGAIFVKDNELAKKIRAIKSHGGLARFNHKYIGMNSRLDTLQASVLLVKMKYLDEVLDARRKCAEYYTSKLIEFNLKDIILPKVEDNCIHVWAQYSILAKDKEQRDKIVDELKKARVNVAIFYPSPLYKQECFSFTDCTILKNSSSVCDQVFNLPCYGEITENELKYIINIIYQILI
jgi:UDP-2-acetamido-2-deoxy-ribo-hexuluronate aminotransferase